MLAFLMYNFILIFLTPFLTFLNFLSLLSISLFLWVFYFPLEEGVLNLSLIFGVDTLSYALVYLTLWIIYLGLLSSWNLSKEGYNFSLFLFLVCLLMVTLLFTFLTYNAMLFYFFFEASLVPLLMLIIGYGYQPEKLSAGMYMLFYTMFGSLPLLVGLLMMMELGGLNFFYYNMFSQELYSYLFFLIYFAFLIKLPGYLVHLWLPKAHVEAPVFGSMILAGVMLKMGGYGMLRLISLFTGFLVMYGDLILSFFLGGGVIMSFVCLSQSDLKALVAYSSVGHMSMFLGGLLSLSNYGYMGALLIMLAHGFTSSGLFSIVNMVYERIHTRSLLMIRGLTLVLPSISFLWFILSLSNMAAPPFLNLLGELYLSFGIVSFSLWYMVPLGFMFFLAASYSLYMYSISQHGKFWLFSNFYPLDIKEYLILWGHIYPLLVLMLNINLMV
uniref:NADH-ubiquinone oxidoreductase chain 4 n=1 Tax=Oligolophus tienmushanensis TaxID=1508515 RepID=A0A140X731_9ARAC|nr:NADH dehydrogenase subunit 4 [Oligolophus tienmushanensis]AIG60116.1 NADH dehydrogenase subunit 4 [Oligolophus tienmushanensis]